MTGLGLDVRYAFRSLRRSPGLFAVALITIALGVGANTAMFSVLHSVVLSPLPYPEADRLVSLWPEKRWSTGMLVDVRERVQSYEAIATRTGQPFMLLGDGPAEMVPGSVVSATFFEVLGVRPQLGAGFVPGDAQAERGAVVVLSDGLWRDRFGADPEIVGRSLRLAALGVEARTVVGVMPPGDYMGGEAWAPIVEVAGQPGAYGPYGMNAFGRLRPGVTVERASAELRGLTEELTPLHASQFRQVRYSPVDVVPALEAAVRQVRPQLLVLMGAVGFILLIACTNVANLLLARAHSRQREIAVQSALGGSRGRVMRHILVESVLIGVMGGAAGMAAAYYTLPLIAGFLGAQLPRGGEIALDGTVLAFALAASLVAGLAFGAAPALRAARAEPGTLMRSDGRGQTQGRRAGRVNDALVAAEVALCLVLLAGAGLMLKSLWQLTRVDTGLATDHVLTLQYTVPPGRYDGPALAVLGGQLQETMAAVPGVAAVSPINYLPLTGSWAGLPYTVEGQTTEDVSYVVSGRVITPAFFDVFRIPAIEGRLLGDEDMVEAEVASLVVNQTFARLHWPAGGAIGRQVLTTQGEPMGVIVGVVRDARMGMLDSPAQPEIIGTAGQYGWDSSGFFVVRGDGALPRGNELAAAMRAIEPDLAIRNVRPMEEVIAGARAGPRFYTSLLLAFAALALLLSIVGVYGVVSYAVTRRTRELGVRIALGASTRDVMVGVVRRALAPVAIGVAIGLATALVLTRLMAGLVYEVQVTDPWVLAAGGAVLVAAAVLAALVPAFRAARVSPVTAMNN